jgi:hypothetical protein
MFQNTSNSSNNEDNVKFTDQYIYLGIYSHTGAHVTLSVAWGSVINEKLLMPGEKKFVF